MRFCAFVVIAQLAGPAPIGRSTMPSFPEKVDLGESSQEASPVGFGKDLSLMGLREQVFFVFQCYKPFAWLETDCLFF